MKIKSTFISLLLLLGVFQLSAQIIAPRDCASLVRVDQECLRDGTVTISFYLSNNTRCDARGVTITPVGGFGQSFPINIPGQTVSNYLFTYTGYAPGSQACFEIILHGANGRECCRTRVCVDISCCTRIRPVDCTGLAFTRTQADNIAPDVYQETFVSDITATLRATLQAYGVPDQLIVWVNGTQVLNFSAGSHPCDGPSPATVSGTFCVRRCDVITYRVNGNICPLGGTAWRLTVDCSEGCNIIGTKITNETDSDMLSSRSSSQSGFELEEEMAEKSLKVTPNPVVDMVRISNVHALNEYQTARVINSSGKLMYTQNISNQDQLEINASTYPQGIYFIELTDNNGHRVLEKFMKQ